MTNDVAATHRSASDIIGTIGIGIWRVRQWRPTIGVRPQAWAAPASGSPRPTRKPVEEQNMITLKMTEIDSLTAQVMPLLGTAFARLSMSTTPWASASFEGHRHKLIFTGDTPLDQPTERRLSVALADHEFDLSGVIVADAHLARVSPDGRTVAVELITVKG
jgi:hypothetical protein